MSTTFTNKEEYLAYRIDWKTKYKEISQIIRDKKWIRDEYSRAYNKAIKQNKCKGYEWYYQELWKLTDELLKTNIRYVRLMEKYKDDKLNLEKYRIRARNMNEELELAKKEVNRQYNLKKQQETSEKE